MAMSVGIPLRRVLSNCALVLLAGLFARAHWSHAAQSSPSALSTVSASSPPIWTPRDLPGLVGTANSPREFFLARHHSSRLRVFAGPLLAAADRPLGEARAGAKAGVVASRRVAIARDWRYDATAPPRM